MSDPTVGYVVRSGRVYTVLCPKCHAFHLENNDLDLDRGEAVHLSDIDGIELCGICEEAVGIKADFAHHMRNVYND